MMSLADFAAAKYALVCHEAGGDLLSFKEYSVSGYRHCNLVDVMEEALEKGCRDVEVIRAVARARMGAMTTSTEIEVLVRDAVQNGWKEAFGLKWCMKHVTVTSLAGNVVNGMIIDGTQYGGIWSKCGIQMSMSVFPSDVARHLIHTAYLNPSDTDLQLMVDARLHPERRHRAFSENRELPKYAKFVTQGRMVTDSELNYYLYTIGDIRRMSANTRFKEPDYSDARKAAASLSDRHFDRIGRFLLTLRVYGQGPAKLMNMLQVEKVQLEATYQDILDRGDIYYSKASDWAIIKAWCEDMRPLCAIL